METVDAPREKSPFGPGSNGFQLGLCSFGVLALELGVIRWISGQIRIVAYFSNLILLGAFLGMGLGIALGRRRPGLIHWALPALSVFSAILAFSDELNLMHIRFPDPSLSLWGGETLDSVWGFVLITLFMVCVFWSVAGIFLLASTPIGWLFDRLPPLSAYSADVLGSVLGVIAGTVLAALGTSPAFWLGLACLPLMWLSRRLISVAAGIVVIGLAAYSVHGALFSPYNRIDIRPYEFDKTSANHEAVHPEWTLSVNRDFHQIMVDASDRAMTAETKPSMRWAFHDLYTLPFSFHGEKGGRALIVGAGTGNDVMAALRSDFGEVYSIDIDRQIIESGRRLHPEQPYSDPRAKPVVNDARAFFEQNPGEQFDVVCYGFLDSHAMFSSMSTLRLDNFVYTVEGIRAGWSHVKEDGVLSVCFSVYAGDWMIHRMAGIIREATGIAPVIVLHNRHHGATFLTGRKLDPKLIPQTMGKVFVNYMIDPHVQIPTDDWPFLYMRPNTVPYGYLAVLFFILVTSTFAVRGVYGKDMFTTRRFHIPLFLMGAAFMLIETRMVTELSLLFGSTWIVNSCVFVGILLMVLLANSLVSRFQPKDPKVWFIPLAISLLVTWATGAGLLNKLPLLERGLVGGVLYAIPVAFAGIIFSTLLKRAKDPTSAIASNLLGAVVGGVMEYASMYCGLKALALAALGFYLAALLYIIRRPEYAEEKAA
jgi:spermidine synthase